MEVAVVDEGQKMVDPIALFEESLLAGNSKFALEDIATRFVKSGKNKGDVIFDVRVYSSDFISVHVDRKNKEVSVASCDANGRQGSVILQTSKMMLKEENLGVLRNLIREKQKQFESMYISQKKHRR